MPPEADPAPDISSSQLLLRAALWIGLGTIAAMLAGMLWFDAQAERLRLLGRERAAVLLAEVLGHAVQDAVIQRNYGQLEKQLKQTLADAQVMSALVTDERGAVLSHVRRESASQQPRPVYSITTMAPPGRSPLIEPEGDLLRYWSRLEAGMPIGWIRLEVAATETESALIELRHRASLLFAGACLLLLSLLAVVLRRTQALIGRRESRLRQKHDALEQVAYQDSVTRLPNRHLLLDRLDLTLARCRRDQRSAAVCFLDLDGFKAINDRYGHGSGNQVLNEVARRLERCVREHDTVARLGGDEFVLVLTDIEPAGSCEAILQRVLEAIRQPIGLGAHSAQVSSSIGVAIYLADDTAPGELLEQADQAMYQAKRAGKNRWQRYQA
jgi:diguanylate cyclase (GGDEF)-like protein